MLTIDEIRNVVVNISNLYQIKKVSLFGSYANGTATEDSDVDMLIEFKSPGISLFTLTNIKFDIMDKLNKEVDIIHGPLNPDSMIIIEKVIDIYEQ